MVRDIKNAKSDLDAQLNEAFNSMIGDVLSDLATEANSPVYTGFLASSWRAQKSQVRQKDRVEDHEPWASIKREHNKLISKTSQFFSKINFYRGSTWARYGKMV